MISGAQPSKQLRLHFLSVFPQLRPHPRCLFGSGFCFHSLIQFYGFTHRALLFPHWQHWFLHSQLSSHHRLICSYCWSLCCQLTRYQVVPTLRTCFTQHRCAAHDYRLLNCSLCWKISFKFRCSRSWRILKNRIILGYSHKRERRLRFMLDITLFLSSSHIKSVLTVLKRDTLLNKSLILLPYSFHYLAATVLFSSRSCRLNWRIGFFRWVSFFRWAHRLVGVAISQRSQFSGEDSVHEGNSLRKKLDHGLREMSFWRFEGELDLRGFEVRFTELIQLRFWKSFESDYLLKRSHLFYDFCLIFELLLQTWPAETRMRKLACMH